MGALLALVLLLLAPSAGAGTLLENRTLVHGGVTRWFDVYEPDGLGSQPVPLLLLLHGGTQDKSAMRSGASLEFLTIADRETFLVLIPNGTVSPGGTSGPTGSFNWNDCRGDMAVGETPADDVGFLAALIDWAQAGYPIDAERVYATGASNGGLMSYRLAFELSERIAAIGAVIANLPAQSQCPAPPAHPLSVLIMNGTADPLMPWGGGAISGNRGTVFSAAATREFFRNFLGTAPDPVHTLFPDLDPADAGRAERGLYGGGAEGTEVAFYMLSNGGHNFPSIAHPLTPLAESIFGRQNHDIEAAEEVWSFLSRHTLSGTAVPGLPRWGWLGLTVALAAAVRARARRGGASPRMR